MGFFYGNELPVPVRQMPAAVTKNGPRLLRLSLIHAQPLFGGLP